MHTTTLRSSLIVVAAVLMLGTSGCAGLDGLLSGDGEVRDPETQEVVEPGQADVFDVEVGDCFDDDPGAEGEITELPLVPCEDPHDNEIYFAFQLPEGAFPGDDKIAAAVEAQCIPAFTDFVGLAYDDSVLEMFPITPTNGSWEGGDREVDCVAYDPAGPISGSLAGVAR